MYEESGRGKNRNRDQDQDPLSVRVLSRLTGSLRTTPGPAEPVCSESRDPHQVTSEPPGDVTHRGVLLLTLCSCVGACAWGFASSKVLSVLDPGRLRF